MENLKKLIAATEDKRQRETMQKLVRAARKPHVVVHLCRQLELAALEDVKNDTNLFSGVAE